MSGLAEAQNRLPFSKIENAFAKFQTPKNQMREMARKASTKTKARPQSLPRQRDIRRALIEADLMDTALRDNAFPKGEAIPQILSAAKNNMIALPG